MIDEQQVKKDIDEVDAELDKLILSSEAALTIADKVEAEADVSETDNTEDDPETIETQFDTDLNDAVLDLAPKE